MDQEHRECSDWQAGCRYRDGYKSLSHSQELQDWAIVHRWKQQDAVAGVWELRRFFHPKCYVSL